MHNIETIIPDKESKRPPAKRRAYDALNTLAGHNLASMVPGLYRRPLVEYGGVFECQVIDSTLIRAGVIDDSESAHLMEYVINHAKREASPVRQWQVSKPLPGDEKHHLRFLELAVRHGGFDVRELWEPWGMIGKD